MKSKNLLLALISFVLGALLGYIIANRKKEILKKIGEIEERLKENDLTLELREKIKDIIDTIKSLLNKDDKLAKKEEEDIIRIVEEKIKKLEKIIHS